MIIQKGSTIGGIAALVTSQNPTVYSFLSPVINVPITQEINLGFAIVLILALLSSLNHIRTYAFKN